MTTPADQQTRDASARRSAGLGTPRRATVIIIVCVCALVAGTVVLGLLQDRTNSVPLSVHNPGPGGARAAAQILGEHGIEVQEVTTTSAALADARPEGTVLITGADNLRTEQLEALATLEANVVLIGVDHADLGPVTDRFRIAGGGKEGTYSAECSDPAASAAGQLHTSGPGLVPTGDVTTCFPLGAGSYAYGTWTSSGQRWTVLPNDHPVTNVGLAEAGNAALVMHSLGATDHLTWYVPNPDDDFGLDSSGPATMIPPMVAVQIMILLIAVALWRGRRLGPVVTEPLPVVVRATETLRGRGRLYRRGKAYAHAGAALRAGTLSRIGPHIGLPHSAGRTAVIGALAHATGRTEAAIEDLLYGPSPADDASLMNLAQALDTLEEEVAHR